MLESIAGIVGETIYKLNESEKLAASEHKYRDLVENANSIIVKSDSNGKILFFNEFAQKFFGYSEDEIVGKDWLETIIPKTESSGRNLIVMSREILKHPELFESNENENVKRSGERVWVSWKNKAFLDERGDLVELLSVGTDITEHKQLENALCESEEMLRLFVEHAPASLAMFDGEMRYLGFSRRWMSDFNLVDRDLRGLSHYDVFPEIPDSWKEVHRQALAGEVIRADSDRFERADGTEQCLRWEVRPWRNAAGQIGGIVIFSEDMTKSQRADEAVRKSEAMLRAVLDQMPSGVTVTDARTGALILSNAQSLEIMGAMAGIPEQFARHCIFHPDGRPCLSEEWPVSRSLATGEVVEAEEFECERSDSTRITLSVSSAPVRDSQGQIVSGVGVFHDITRRKTAENELRAYTEQLDITQ